MKKLLLILLIFISLTSFAQMQVKENSFHQIDGFVMLDKNEHYDDNNLPMALIKISTENITAEERRRITFKGNLATYFDVHFEPTEIHLYISAQAATFIEIHHPDYGKTEFTLPYDLKDFAGYEMVLQYVLMGTENEIIKPRNTYLIITSDQDNAVIYIDDKFVGTKEVSKSFDIGTTHTWKIECNMYHTESGTVTLNDKTIISKNLRPNFGYISVTSSPESGAKVFVDGNYIGETPCKTDRLKSGSHSVKVMKEMYNSTEKSIVVNDGQTTNANIEMSVNFVNVTINTDADSDIYVDEELKGKGSWSGRLSEGSHYLEARKPSHETTAKNINLTIGKNETITLEAPKPIYGFLDINTTPIMADIYIDGKHYGQTPSVISDLLIGEHELKLEKSGCTTLTKTITIKENETLTINEKLQTGKEITISTDQSGDKIYVDGIYLGVSPITSILSYGSHPVTAIRGSQTTTKTINVKTTSFKEEFFLSFGQIIKISSNKNGDNIIVDGKKVGKTPMEIDLSLGEHKVKVRRGLKKEIRTINVAKNGPYSYIYTPKRETFKEYMSNGIHYLTLDVYPFLYDMGIEVGDWGGVMPGLTYGMRNAGLLELGWGLGWSISLSPCIAMVNVSWCCIDYGVGVDYMGDFLWNIGETIHLRRFTFKFGIMTTKNEEYISVGIGYNFKHW